MSTGSITDYPKVLILEPGDAIEARFVRLEKAHTRDGDERAIAILELNSEERALWLHETALRGQFRQVRPKAGELIQVEKGAEKRESGSGYKYWPFRVRAPERQAAEVGWDDALLAGDELGPDASSGATAKPSSAAPVSDEEIPF